MRVLMNKSFLCQKFEFAEFEGKWLESFARPELRGVWTMYGHSGQGKTSFCLQLGKYLTNFGKVRYVSLEQGVSLSLQQEWQRENIADCGNAIALVSHAEFEDVVKACESRKAAKIWIIDSINYWQGTTYRQLRTKLIDPNADKLFVFIAHEKNNQPNGSVAQQLYYHSDVKMHIEGFKVFINSRFATEEEGGEPYIVWQEGAGRYWNESI